MEPNNNNALTLEDALKFLIDNRSVHPRNIDKRSLKAAVAVFTNSASIGLSAKHIKVLGFEIIFRDHYDIPTRRKLLNSCIPVSSDFPYEVIPLAASSAALVGVSSSWQQSILTWLSALLHFNIIDDSNRLVHICYPTLFCLLSHFKACETVCKILCQITRREDVTPARVQVLLKLERKLGFRQFIPHLIRIYKVFRPDLVVYRLDVVKRFPAVPKWLQTPLIAARARLEDEEDDGMSKDSRSLWPDLGVKRKANPFHEPSALPYPEILIYAEKIEEQKKRMIAVLQFKSIKDMIKHMSLWKEWRWPNSASCLLWKPASIALFKPHDVHLKIAVTNWLEVALRTEVIEQLGNPSKQRQENLLTACIRLVKQTETLVPAVYHFILEFLAKWDRFSHMPLILELLSYVPFVSPTSFFETVMEGFSEIMSTATVSLTCAILNSFSNTCLTWGLQAEKDRNSIKKSPFWPFPNREVSPLEGIHFLTQRLERIIMAAFLRFGPHPLLFTAVLNYYMKVNMCCEELSLPLVLFPPIEVVFMVLTSADVVATHRLGLLISRMRTRIEEIKKSHVIGDEKLMRSVTLCLVERINFSVIIYLDTLLKTKSFNTYWMETLSPFLGESFAMKLRSVYGISTYGNIFKALSYLPLTVNYSLQQDLFADPEKLSTETERIVNKLADMNLQGIRACAETYILTG